MPIAGNDDAIRSVELITKAIADTIAEARREAPKREESEEGEEGQTTYSSDRGTEPAGEGDEASPSPPAPSREARSDCGSPERRWTGRRCTRSRSGGGQKSRRRVASAGVVSGPLST